jgi:hypothetical protein
MKKLFIVGFHAQFFYFLGHLFAQVQFIQLVRPVATFPLKGSHQTHSPDSSSVQHLLRLYYFNWGCVIQWL